MSLTVVGSIAFDAVKTPFGERERMLGGAAVHFSLAASFFTEVRPVGPVGEDFGDEEFEVLRAPRRAHRRHRARRRAASPSSGAATTTSTSTSPTPTTPSSASSPSSSRSSRRPRGRPTPSSSPTSSPTCSARCAPSATAASFSGLDSMNLWIETAKDSLLAAIAEVDCLVVNDAEIRQLTGESNLARAARAVMDAGPAGGGRQAGRVRRRALHRGRLLRPARVPARGRARPDRRRRQLRRRLLRLPRRPRRRARRGRAAAGDGLRHRARLLQRRGVRHRAGRPPEPRGDRRALRGAARDDPVRGAPGPAG